MVKSFLIAAAGVLSVLFGGSAATAADVVEDAAFAVDDKRDLAFPAAPEPFGTAKASKMFKPDGQGPFPGLVIMPTCAGLSVWFHAFDWAKHALARGYATLVVDPLTLRGAGAENCNIPNKVIPSRYRKDGFDAAAHLRKQPFVDSARIGMLGLSFGAMSAMSSTAKNPPGQDGRPAFGAIVAIYPVCYFANIRSRIFNRVVDIRYVPFEVVVPLQVQMGEADTEGPPDDCLPLLNEQRSKGAPVEYMVHKNATHSWDVTVLGAKTHEKVGPKGQKILYRHDPKVTAESVALAFDFLDRHLKQTK